MVSKQRFQIRQFGIKINEVGLVGGRNLLTQLVDLVLRCGYLSVQIGLISKRKADINEYDKKKKAAGG